MTRRIEPRWALCGYVAAPLICAVNATLGALFSGYKPRHVSFLLLQYGFSFALLTWPFALLTAWVLALWNDGHFSWARGLSLGCGMSITALWIWGEKASPAQLDSPEVVGGLLLPWLWSVGFFVFAFFARPPKI